MSQFNGIEQLYGTEQALKIHQLHVCVIGLGGVGSWAVESLVRSGVGQITLVDMDEVCLSNINRQLQATQQTVGQAKTTALKERILSINPRCQVNEVFEFYTEKTADKIFSYKFDAVIDAIDSLGPKCHLISTSVELAVPIIVTGAAGGKRDPTTIQLADLNRSYNDNLLYRVRKKLRRDFAFSRSKNKWDIPCLFSPEETLVGKQNSQPASSLANCEHGLGAVVHVTALFGFMAAHCVIERAIATNC